MAQDGHSVGVAFALCLGAGLATVLGGLVVFSKRLISLASPTSLAVALSVSAGVMVFISLVEIFHKSIDAFALGIRTDDISEATATGHAWLAATVCFGAGIALIYAIDVVLHKLSPEFLHATEIENLEHLRESIEHHEHREAETESAGYLEAPTPKDATALKLEADARQQLIRTGLLTALVLGLHNLPEGIATFVSAVKDSSVGLALAVGIGIHNIPEGIAVAAPIYFATGSRWKGIMWCAISAAAEPLGGFLAWLAIGDGMNPVTEGILFGLVCGIMVCICVKELWPTAYKFAKGRTHLVAMGTFAGMFIMASSPIVFGYAGV